MEQIIELGKHSGVKQPILTPYDMGFVRWRCLKGKCRVRFDGGTPNAKTGMLLKKGDDGVWSLGLAMQAKIVAVSAKAEISLRQTYLPWL